MHFWDIDNTLLDTKTAVLDCQKDALQRLTGTDKFGTRVEQGELLKDILKEVGCDLTEFFRDHYKTFNPYQYGEGLLFPQTKPILESKYNIAISNSSLDATKEKLIASGIDSLFEAQFAEYEKEKAKPGIYMGIQALDFLDQQGLLSQAPLIIGVGDDARDIAFYNDLKKEYNNIESVHIAHGLSPNREADRVINSLDEL